MPTQPDDDLTDYVDPDVDLHDPAQRAELIAHPAVLPVIAIGGAAGASARYALELLWPPGSGVPWATVVANLSGCLLIGVVMVVVHETRPQHPLWRPFLGVGVLGGYTTFSTYAVQVQQAILHDEPVLGLSYLIGSLAGALLAVLVGAHGARAALRVARSSVKPGGRK